MLAFVGDAILCFPERAHDLQAFFENALVVVEIDVKRLVFAPVIAAPGGEIDAAVAQQIERRPLLGDADRMMQRHHGHRRREADAAGARRDVGQHQVGAGQDAERVEMMLADPGRMHAELFGIERLVGDVLDEGVGGTGVVLVVIVAEREVAEFHGLLPRGAVPLPALSDL